MPIEQYDLTVGDVADLLHVHPDTIRRWSAKGDLPSWTTPGGQRRFRRADVDALLPDLPTDATEATA